MQTIAAFAIGAIAGLLVGRRFPRREVSGDVLDVLPPSLPDEVFTAERQMLIERYERSMAQFDRLVPWGAGGTIVVSATLLAQLRPPDVLSAAALGLGWFLLLIALTASTWSHFTSSRLFSARRGMMDMAQDTESNQTDYQVLATAHAHASRATYWLNWSAALTFPLGVVGVALYAFLAALA